MFQSLTEPGSEYDEIVKRFEHIVFQTHVCSSQWSIAPCIKPISVDAAT